METLIELYDERAIENVLAPETFRPKKVVYLCPPDIMSDPRKQRVIRDYFAWRRFHVRLEFLECSQYDVKQILSVLNEINARNNDCVIDVTGGTDDALFAAGMFCQMTGTPALTYSRRNSCFFNISGAAFAEDTTSKLTYSVADFFRMTGGRMRPGRVDNRVLNRYAKYYEPFFRVFLSFRREWSSAVTYFQRISQGPKDAPVSLSLTGEWSYKGEHGARVHANPALLNALQKLGFIHDVQMIPDETVSFRFHDEQIRTWLRDVGSVLELFMYKCCLDAGIFSDVVSSAVVDWDDYDSQHTVCNEIDAVAAMGTTPLFISCKACDIRTEALNELAILRDRFGGKGARALIVTTERCTAAARHRAAQLKIAVIDLEQLRGDSVPQRLQVIMKARQDTDSAS